MDESINDQRCPICQEPNHCGEQTGDHDHCWCASEQFPKGIFDWVPSDLLHKSCICRECLDAYKREEAYPSRFYLSLSLTNQCNLRCDYCYVFNDSSCRNILKPEVITDAVIQRTAQQFAAYCAQHRFSRPIVYLYGGEPLLVGKETISNIVGSFRQSVQEILPIEIELALQTNGTLLDESWISFLVDVGVSTGISVDHPAASHKIYRKFLDGRSSYSKVSEAAKLLAESEAGKRVFRWVLSRIDINTNPLEAYQHFKSLSLNRCEFLFPICDYTDKPPGKSNVEKPVYADWLIPIFDEWYHKDRDRIYLQPFEAMIKALNGDGCFLDYIVSDMPIRGIFIQTDGTYTSSFDYLAESTAPAKWSVFQHDFGEVLSKARSRHSPSVIATLPSECQACCFMDACGGDYRGHRRSKASRYDKPSVYCSDLKKLLSHIHSHLNS